MINIFHGGYSRTPNLDVTRVGGLHGPGVQGAREMSATMVLMGIYHIMVSGLATKADVKTHPNTRYNDPNDRVCGYELLIRLFHAELFSRKRPVYIGLWFGHFALCMT